MSPRQAVVRLWNGLPEKQGSRFIGTAFFIASNTLLTAKHIVNKYPVIYLDGVPGGGKDKIDPENIILCENRDVAILKVSISYDDVSPLCLTSKKFAMPQTVTSMPFP